jgi:predicted amidohydrolase YtcJ
MTGTILIRNVADRGRPGLDVRVGPEAILEVGLGLRRDPGEQVLNGAGGAIIPGLHDHHVHLRAAVAARQSLDVSSVRSPEEFDRVISTAAHAAGHLPWLRVTGWHEHAAGTLDRHRLDRLAGPLPVRVQHRGGAMWVLNSPALQQAGADQCDLPGIERDAQGELTGQLVRLDSWLRDRLPPPADEDFAAGLTAYAADAAMLGVTGFTDATPDRDQSDVAEFTALSATGTLPQRLVLMGPCGLTQPAGGRVSIGPVKVILDDTTLPGLAEFVDLIVAAHREGRPAAVHCVTAEQLVITVAALEQAGSAGDRIEHAGIVPPGYSDRLAALGVTVVTQPGFITARGDDYRRDVESAEQAWLYPCASLIRAGVTVAAGTDAPFGPANPWHSIAAATTRRTPSGYVLGHNERVSATEALRLFLAAPDDLSRIRTIAPCQPSDICVLSVPLAEALTHPAMATVRATIAEGRRIAGED